MQASHPNRESRFEQERESFRRSLELFHQINSEYARDEGSATNQMALAHAFMLLVELSWKIMRHLIKTSGETEAHSPKTIILKAQRQGLIESAEDWIEAVKNRNLTVHVYDPSVTNQALIFVRKKFSPMVNDLGQKLDSAE